MKRSLRSAVSVTASTSVVTLSSALSIGLLAGLLTVGCDPPEPPPTTAVNAKATASAAPPLAPPPDAGAPAATHAWPATRRDATVDTYFGTEVKDPYRWLEDDTSKDTADWVTAQNAYTRSVLAGATLQKPVTERLTQLWNFARRNPPVRQAGHLYYRENSGLQKQSVLYEQATLDAAPKVLLDPNTLSADGSVAFSDWSISPTGKHLAYGLSLGGADWTEYHVKDLVTGKDLPDVVKWVKWSSASFTNDGKGFFYSRYPEPPTDKLLQTKLQNHRVYYHVIGTPQSADKLVFELPKTPDYWISPWVTEDGRYLVLSSSDETTNVNLDFVDLGDPMHPNVTAKARSIVAAKDAVYYPLGNVGHRLFIHTDLDAPKRRIIAVDLDHPERAAWKTVVPEGSSALESVALVGGKLALDYLVDAHSRLSIVALDGKPISDIALPGIVAVEAMSGRTDTQELFYAFDSYLQPLKIVRHDLATQKDTTFFEAKVPFQSADYETRQLFFTSKDGTRVPMFVTSKKGLAAGPKPTILYGYGGFAASETPYFSPEVAAWLELGGVYAVPSLRGGGEYGEAWHRAGMREHKQNVFDDFISAAEYLIHENMTTPAQLAIRGASNGGLLVGAAMTQRPELFAAALPNAGVLDMLRYQRFSGGALWSAEFGSSETEADFRVLRAYSPLHNVKPNTCYPATMVIAADHDDRVVPAHSFKFISALQAADSCDKPLTIRIETQGSHGYRPTDKRIAEAADALAFIASQVGLSR